MKAVVRENYILLLSYNPCDIFDYFNVDEMHGLSYKECECYLNTNEDSYIAGWSNFVPKISGEYISNDSRFVFINLSRCNTEIETFGLIMHELMHHSFFLHDYNSEKEEEIITWSENESYEVFEIIETYKNTNK